MPSYDNAAQLADQIISCENKFDSFFEGLNKSADFERQLNKIKAYYRRAFNKTTSECGGVDVLEEYQYLLLTVEQLKAGTISSDQAIEAMNDLADCRTLEVLLVNAFKMCELLFWAAAAAACYVACLTVGVPALACEPIIGFAVVIGTAALFLNVTEKCLNCFEEFQSFDPVEAQATREQNMVRFFAPVITLQKEVAELAEEESSSLSSSQ